MGENKKINKNKILKRIEIEENFQNQQYKMDMHNHKLSRGQRKKMYEKIISSIENVIKLNQKIGVKPKDKSKQISYFKTKLKNITESILKSQTKGKRIVLFEKKIA